jgi:hypothetical protein
MSGFPEGGGPLFILRCPGAATVFNPISVSFHLLSDSIFHSRQIIIFSYSIDKFLLHAAEFGFFLDILSFHRSTLLIKLPFGHPQRPTAALLTTAYLWGVHLLRPNPPSQVDENALLIRALHHVATDTLGTHPKRILHTIQAEVLLTTYFFRTGRLLEAKARLSSAVSLVLSTQMQRIRSQYPLFTPTSIVNDRPVFLQAPQHTVEEGELINGFWTVYSLHKMLSIALDPPGSVFGALEAPGFQVDTPWPFESHEYRNVRVAVSYCGLSVYLPLRAA